MFRLGLIRYIIHKALQSSIAQEYPNLNRKLFCQHISSLKLKNIGVSDITSNRPNAQYLTHASNIRKEESEQDFLVHLKNDPDIFGDAANTETVIDPLDLEEEKHFEQQTSSSQKLRITQYADLIKSFIRKRKIKEAIDVLEVKMLKEDQVKPISYIYNLLLGACGRVGYTKKAFSLYNQMKKRGLKATGGTYTALFNACANSPWPEDGLSRARHLQSIMIEKMYEPNDSNYNAMIKAFGRCGDLAAAFSLVDEMIAKKFKIKSDTMNFLLQACIQDKDAGFRHAILVWRKIVEKNVAPDLYTYNLMLRCIRDCGIGDVEVMNDTLNIILNKNVKLTGGSLNKLLFHSSHEEKLLIKSMDQCNDVISQSYNEPTTVDDVCRPNLMAKVPHLGNIISLSEVTKAEDRLLLVGGLNGFLKNMEENNCIPDIKSFTQLLDSLPGSLTTEKELMKAMKKYKVKPDLDFLNMLIKKRSIRFDYESAKAVLEEIKEYGYMPNLITFGVLALGCKTKEEALELLANMKEHSYSLNTEILGAMLHQACYHRNFPYVLEIMEITLRENVNPNKIFMERLEEFKKRCKHISNDKDNKLSNSQGFQKGFRIFQMRYKTWLNEVTVDDTEDVHPWAQYRQPTETDTRHYKDKSHRFKPRHLSRFKHKPFTNRKNK